ncbi:hypothetical protein [Nocardia barduliensis]|nr:hypothetical protein [Nocardia barduliensis]
MTMLVEAGSVAHQTIGGGTRPNQRFQPGARKTQWKLRPRD